MNKQQFLTAFLLHQPKHNYFEGPFTANERSKKAAVLIPLVERNNQLHVILTVRASHLRHHPGQVSFPGGGFEIADKTLEQTALRETFEEIGIEADDIQIFAQFPAFVTNSNYIVQPYLAFIDAAHHVHIDENEVQSTFEVPLSFLLDDKNTQSISFLRNGKTFTTYCTLYKKHLIWGVTAQIINTLKSHFNLET